MSGLFVRVDKEMEIEGGADQNEDIGGRLLAAEDREVRKLGVSLGNHNVVAGEQLRSGKSDINLFVLLLLDGDSLLEAVVMQTHTLDRYIILTGRDRRNIYPVLLVSGINLINNTSAGMVKTVKNDQHRISAVGGVDVSELESNGTGIHDFSRSG